MGKAKQPIACNDFMWSEALSPVSAGISEYTFYFLPYLLCDLTYIGSVLVITLCKVL